jgi:hypothetical protein
MNNGVADAAKDHAAPTAVPGRGNTFAVLLGLTGFTIAQPLLSLAGANPTLFVFNNVSRTGMVALAPTEQGPGFVAMLLSALRGQDVALDIVLVDPSGNLALAAVESS